MPNKLRPKNGFTFVESIVAIVILTGSLLLLYSSFSRLLQNEKNRVYYDSVSYIYRTEYIRKSLADLNFDVVMHDMESNNKSFAMLGIEYDSLFLNHEKSLDYMASLLNEWEVKELLVIKKDEISNLKKCTVNCSLDSTCDNYNNCSSLYLNVSSDMISYLKTVNVDLPCSYILVASYETCSGEKCQNFYSWVRV